MRVGQVELGRRSGRLGSRCRRGARDGRPPGARRRPAPARPRGSPATARVPAHRDPLLGVELARLVEDRLETPSLPMSCSSAGAAQVAQLGARRAERDGDADGDTADARRSGGRCKGDLASIDPREGLGDAVEAGVVGALHAVGRLQRRRRRRSRGEARRAGRASAARANASTSAGSNQRAAALARHRAGGGGAVLRREDLDRLGQADDAAPAAGWRRRRRPQGWPWPSQCSSSGRMASGGVLRRARSCARCRRRARSASAASSRAPSTPMATRARSAARAGERRARGDACGSARAATAPAGLGSTSFALALDARGRRRRTLGDRRPTWSSSRRP